MPRKRETGELKARFWKSKKPIEVTIAGVEASDAGWLVETAEELWVVVSDEPIPREGERWRLDPRGFAHAAADHETFSDIISGPTPRKAEALAL